MNFKKKSVSKKAVKKQNNKTNKSYFQISSISNEQIKELKENIGDTCEIFDDFVIDNDRLELGKGSYGVVKRVCKKAHYPQIKKQEKKESSPSGNDCRYVIKTIKFHEEDKKKEYAYKFFLSECLLAKYAGERGFGVPVHRYGLCKDPQGVVNGFIIMEKYDDSLLEHSITYEELLELFHKVELMHDVGILHRDLFLKNVMFKSNNNSNHDQTDKKEFRIIDFGMSIPFEQNIPEMFRCLDFINLISDLDDPFLIEQGLQYLYNKFGKTVVEKTSLWQRHHYNTCLSEYNLLLNLPKHIFDFYGPSTVDLLVWSVRCKPQHDNNIINLANYSNFKNW